MSTGSDVEYDFDLFDDGPIKLNLNRKTVTESRRKIKKINLSKKKVKKVEVKKEADKNKAAVKSVVSRRMIPKIEENVEEKSVVQVEDTTKGMDSNVTPIVKSTDFEEEGYLIEPRRIEIKQEPVKKEPVKKESVKKEPVKQEPIIIDDDEVKPEEVKSEEVKPKKKLKLFRFNKKTTTENEGKENKKKNKKAEFIQAIEEEVFDYDSRYEGRFTEPKKRGLLSRIILQERLARDGFNYIENEYEYLTQQEVDASKNATKRRDKRLYKEVQAYEDATDDVTMRRGWLAFKISLAAVLLAGIVVIANNTIKDFKEQLIPTNQIETIQDNYDVHKLEVDSFVQKVKEEQGYEFVSLSDEQLVEAYVKILQYEKTMYDNQFKNALLHDQELLDKIVRRVYEDEYELFSDDEKRDYRQLAYCILDVAKPNLSVEGNMYIRNPIVCDTVEARNSAKAKGYKMGLYANIDDGIHIKNVGRIITNLRLLEEADFIAASEVNEGQDFLEQIVKDALGEGYQNMNPNELKDYKQLVYEMLPDYAKEEYITDPIDIALRYNGYEIGD